MQCGNCSIMIAGFQSKVSNARGVWSYFISFSVPPICIACCTRCFPYVDMIIVNVPGGRDGSWCYLVHFANRSRRVVVKVIVKVNHAFCLCSLPLFDSWNIPSLTRFFAIALSPQREKASSPKRNLSTYTILRSTSAFLTSGTLYHYLHRQMAQIEFRRMCAFVLQQCIESS